MSADGVKICIPYHGVETDESSPVAFLFCLACLDRINSDAVFSTPCFL